ncbi:hypothetical protein [Nocardioides jejuensis]|nr:hypothetical protein [Nocardioides jejuensis]
MKTRTVALVAAAAGCTTGSQVIDGPGRHVLVTVALVAAIAAVMNERRAA